MKTDQEREGRADLPPRGVSETSCVECYRRHVRRRVRAADPTTWYADPGKFRSRLVAPGTVWRLVERVGEQAPVT